jgi:HAD superfamily hydrolase (TIGR01509 family)
MIKTILFDNDGVLVDTEKYFFESTKLILAKNGIELTEDKFIELTLIGNEGGWRLARDAGFSEEEIDQMRIERNQIYSKYLSGGKLLIDGAAKTLAELSRKYKLGIVTSSKKNHFDLIHRDTNILHYFSFVLTRQDYSKSKPSPEPYLKALEMSGCLAHECVVVEDSVRGLSASCGAGIKCIIIPNRLTLNCDFSKAWKTLKSIEELPNAL